MDLSVKDNNIIKLLRFRTVRLGSKISSLFYVYEWLGKNAHKQTLTQENTDENRARLFGSGIPVAVVFQAGKTVFNLTIFSMHSKSVASPLSP